MKTNLNMTHEYQQRGFSEAIVCLCLSATRGTRRLTLAREFISICNSTLSRLYISLQARVSGSRCTGRRQPHARAEPNKGIPLPSDKVRPLARRDRHQLGRRCLLYRKTPLWPVFLLSSTSYRSTLPEFTGRGLDDNDVHLRTDIATRSLSVLVIRESSKDTHRSSPGTRSGINCRRVAPVSPLV